MNWSAIRQALRDAAAKLKSNEVTDAAIGELLDAVPVVGGFASSYWSKLDGADSSKAGELARFLEVLGEREARFNAMRDFLQSQSSLTLDLVLESRGSLDMILSLVERVDGGMSELRKEVSELGVQLAEIADVTEAKFVGTAMRVSATLIDDHASRTEMIASITRDLEQAGSAVTEDTLYDMAMMFMLKGKHQLAEAALLEVHHRDGSRDETLIALAQIYQLRAHELVIGKNFGFAEEVLEKSRGYVKVADDDANLEIDLQLAYGYKELGQAYMEAARPGDAAEPLRKARKLFAGVLAVEPPQSERAQRDGKPVHRRPQLRRGDRVYSKRDRPVTDLCGGLVRSGAGIICADALQAPQRGRRRSVTAA